MNFIKVFQSYRSLNSDSIKSNTLYKPSQVLMNQPVKKYNIPHDFFSKINAAASPVSNSNSLQWRKIMYINTDLEYNFDEPNEKEIALVNETAFINLHEKLIPTNPKIITYLLTSICIIFPFTYYYIYNS